MKYIILISILIIGFLIGRFSHQVVNQNDPPEVSHSTSCEDIYQFKDDFEQYAGLKDQSEKYKKADEILNKIITIFLADLGLRLQQMQTGVSLAPETEKKSDPQVGLNQVTPAETKAEDKSALRQQLEIKIIESRQEDEAKEDLKKLEIKDLFSELKNVKPLSDEQVQFILGHYNGEVSFLNNEPSWTIDWILNMRKAGSSWTGKLKLTLTDANGKIFSTSSGSGDIKFFSSLNKSRGILAEVNGGDGVIQIYPNSHLDKIYGNYYKKISLDQYEMIGNVILQKSP